MLLTFVCLKQLCMYQHIVIPGASHATLKNIMQLTSLPGNPTLPRSPISPREPLGPPGPWILIKQRIEMAPIVWIQNNMLRFWLCLIVDRACQSITRTH